MTKLEFATLLKNTLIPLSYERFTNEPAMPYMVYRFEGTGGEYADNINYVNVENITVELYTDAPRNFATEETVESALKTAGISFYKSADFLPDERIYQITYEMEVIING